MKRSAHLRALRPHQWTKNALVFAALVFAWGDSQQPIDADDILSVVLAALGFCLISSCIYLINDIRDRELDRQHPRKRNRPIASGAVAVRTGWIMAATLFVVGLALMATIRLPLAGVGLTYLLMQLGYIFFAKHWPGVDVIIIALGFVLRAVAGAVAIPVTISSWLLSCTFLLALFLALGKRRSEKTDANTDDAKTRPSLQKYNEKLLDRLIQITSIATVISYALYTIAPDTIAKFGGKGLLLTAPLVAVGLFRYHHIIFKTTRAERPEKVLLTDLPMIAILVAYGLLTLGLFLFLKT